jgi:hypothetical protein
MVVKIRITGLTTGHAPLWVREAWIGLEIEAMPVRPGKMFAVNGLPQKHAAGFNVNSRKTIEILRKKSPAAADWWLKNVPWILTHQLFFNAESCEIIV